MIGGTSVRGLVNENGYRGGFSRLFFQLSLFSFLLSSPS